MLAALALAGAAVAASPQGHHHHGHGADADESAAQQASGLPASPSGLRALLEDKVRPSAPGRIAWQTFWKLCWTPVPGATGYELRRMTSEGAPRQPKRVAGPCWRVEVAAGENERSAGLYRRALMLQMQAAQASLRVRATFADGRVSAWTAAVDVGDPSVAPH